MKRTLFTCLVLAAAAICLLVSCAVQNNVPGDGDGIAYIRFGRDDRAFKADYDIQDYDNLYWFYTAEKTDSYGKVGATAEETPVTAEKDESGTITVNKGLSGTIGPFSQGGWKFTLKAYAGLTEDNKTPDSSKLVYENDGTITATLRGGETKSIAAEVKPAGESGYLKFAGAYFKWQDGGSEAPLFKIEAYGIEKAVTYILTNDSSITGANVFKIALGEYDGEAEGYPLKYVLSDGSFTDTFPVAVDYYTCKITAYINGDVSKPVAYDEAFGFRVYGGATTVVSGDLTEKADSYASFDVKKTAIKSFTASSTEEKKIEVAVAPKAEAHNSTAESPKTNTSEVAFEAGALTAADATYCLSAETLSAETASDAFTITAEDGEGSAAVYGSIKLTLDAISGSTSTSVMDFGDKTVTVTTYIAPGLDAEDVTVKYNGEGDQPTDVNYDSTTGKVTFKTKHFSEFVVASKKAAPIYNKSQNRYYSTLEDAFKNLGDTTELELKGDVTVSKTVTIKQNLSLDLGGKTIALSVSSGDGFLLDSSDKAYTVEFRNGKITGKTTNNGFTVKTNATFILDAVTMEDVECKRGVQLFKGSNPAALEIKNGSNITILDGYYAVATNASDAADTYVSIKIDNSTLKTYSSEERTEYKEDTTALLCNVPSTLLISNSNLIGEKQGAIIRGADTEHEKKIVNSTIAATSTKTDYGDNLTTWGEGNGVALAALVIGDKNTGSYPFGTTVELDNVELIIAEEEVRKSLFVYQDGENWPVLVTGTVKGDFTINSDTGGAVVFPEAKVGAKYYVKLQDAIDAAQSGDTVELLKDVDLNVSGITNDNNIAITIDKSLNLKGNGHRLYNDSAFTKQNVKLVAITDLEEGDKVVLEDLTIESSKYAGYFRGLQVQDSNSAEVTLKNVTISLPHYYAIYLIDTDKLTLNISNSTLQGWTTIYNNDSNVTVNTTDTHLISVNPVESGGESNSFAGVIVSEYYSSDQKSENNKMIFTNCVFDVSKWYPTANVKQYIADLRSPCNNTLILNNCKLSPAENSTYISVCADSTYGGTVLPETDKKTNKVLINGIDVTGTDKAKWYIDG